MVFGDNVLCVFKGDNYLRMVFGSNFTSIFTGICGVKGWSGLAFSRNGSMENASISFMVWDDNNIYLLKNHTNHLNISNANQAIQIRKFTTASSLFDVREFNLKIPKHLLEENSFEYIHFSCNTKNSPVMVQINGTATVKDISPHNIVNTISLKNYYFDTVNDCYLVTFAFPKLSDIHIFVFVGEVIVLLLSVPLWVYFKDYQPLKSRSILPIASVLFLYGITMSSLSYISFGLEWCTRYQCVIYSLIVVPAYLILTILIFMVSFNQFHTRIIQGSF